MNLPLSQLLRQPRQSLARYLVIFALILIALLVLVPLPSQAQDSTITFAVIGDYGRNNTPALNVANMVASWNPDFVLTTGDNYYTGAGGSGTGTYDQSTGKFYCRFLKDAAPGDSCGASGMDPVTNRFFPSLGNHDYSDTGGVSVYLSYFTLPGIGFSNSSGNERYYDFVWGPVHFFAINSNSADPDGNSSTSAQAGWLHDRLAASTAPWQVVYLHHPPYSSANGGSFMTLQWPFADWGADVVLAGHNHVYERIVREGIVYFVDGTGGKGLSGFGTTWVTGSEFRYSANYGAMRITASSTALDFEFLSIDNGGTLQDSYHLQGSAPLLFHHFYPLVSNP